MEMCGIWKWKTDKVWNSLGMSKNVRRKSNNIRKISGKYKQMKTHENMKSLRTFENHENIEQSEAIWKNTFEKYEQSKNSQEQIWTSLNNSEKSEKPDKVSKKRKGRSLTSLKK